MLTNTQFTRQGFEAMLATLRPSTLAALVYDIGWAIESRELSPSEWSFLAQLAVRELAQNQGVDKARELIAAEGLGDVPATPETKQ